jgi:serine/threonine-protein kinase
VRRPDPARFAAARARFEELAELETAERAAALAELTESDPELASAVAELLAADEAAGDSFLSEGVGVFAPGIVGEALESGAAGADTGAAAPDDRIGAYRLRALLGRGGMGEVWEAARADGQFEQTVALKLLKRGMDSEAVLARFLRERQILARLEHPGIARLLDGGLAPDGRPYFVLERVEGEPITDWCRQRQSPVAERLRLLIAVAEAVAAAHRNLVVHRDLKPSNILVDAAGQVKLLDFGIAKLLSRDGDDVDRTLLEDRALTPSYAAPEQFRGEVVTTATDVYALGVVLYELLTGRLPHDRTTASSAALAEQVERETLTRPSRAVLGSEPAGRARALEGDLDTIALKALARDPARRYESVTALADDLRRHLDGRPVRARPDSRFYRARKFVGRYRLAVLGTTAAILALAIVAIVARAQARRAEHSAAAAEAAAARAERVRGFLVAVFDAADPARTQGEKIEPKSLVDEGVRRTDAELAADPDLKAEMDDVFAGLYRKLGELESARKLAERALAHRAARLGVESAEAAKSEWTLGWVLSSQGEFKPAKAHLEHAIAVLDRVEGPESLAAADAREPLMELVFGAEGAAAAVPVVERRLATYRAVLGERHEKTALSLSDLGVVLAEVERAAEAEAAYRQSAAILDELLPGDDPRKAYPHSNLTSLLREQGRLEEAEKEARTALAIRRKSLGDRHPETATTLGQLTRVLLALGRLDEAEAAARETLVIVEGRDRFGTAQARANVGAVLLQQGRVAEALETYDRSLAEHVALLPEEHVLVYSARISRIRCLEALGRLDEARSELGPLLGRLEQKDAAYSSPLTAARQIAARLGTAGT